MRVNIGSNAFIMPANELLTPCCAMGKIKTTKKLPNNPDRAIQKISFFDIFFKAGKPINDKSKPDNPALKAPI